MVGFLPHDEIDAVTRELHRVVQMHRVAKAEAFVVGNLGPMAGQNHHFGLYAPEKLPYAIDRYVRETGRLYAVLNKRLADREFIVGDYSVADIASYPWVVPERQQQNLDDFPHLKRWKETIKARPAVIRAYELAKKINVKPVAADEEAKKILFGQSKATVK